MKEILKTKVKIEIHANHSIEYIFHQVLKGFTNRVVLNILFHSFYNFFFFFFFLPSLLKIVLNNLSLLFIFAFVLDLVFY